MPADESEPAPEVTGGSASTGEADANPKETSKEAAAVARQAGRGGLAVTAGKVYFILVGLVQQIALPRVVGSAGYGALSSVLSMASIAYNPIVTTSIQGMSRAVAQTPDAEQSAAVRRALVVHVALALLSAGGFFLLAPVLGRVTGAPHIVPSLRIVSGVLLFYSLYTPLVGVLNGKKKFLHQAGFDIVYATLRTIGLIGGGWWLAGSGRAVEGSSIGFVGASAVIFGAALLVVGIGKRGTGGPSVAQHVAFIAPLLLGQIVFNLLLQADLTLVRIFAADAALAAGKAREAADPLVGAYRATQLFCFLPYQLLISVTFILFPMLATAARDGDREAVARYVRTGVRLALVLAGAMVSVTSGLSGSLLRLIFPAEYAELATSSMQILTIGFGGFAVFGIFITVLNSLQRERVSMLLTAIAFAAVVAISYALVPGTAFGSSILTRTAVATSCGLLFATLTSGFMVKRTAGAVVSPLSLVRVLGCAAVSIAIARNLPYAGKVVTIGFAAVVGVIYVVLLLVTRELGRADVDMVLNVLRKKKAS